MMTESKVDNPVPEPPGETACGEIAGGIAYAGTLSLSLYAIQWGMFKGLPFWCGVFFAIASIALAAIPGAVASMAVDRLVKRKSS